MGRPGAAFLESVRFGSDEETEAGIALGNSAGALELRLNMEGSQVTGVVKGPADNFVSGATVALIPRSSKYTDYQSTFTDQQGAFTFNGIRPGEYRIIALEDVEPGAFQDPEYLKRYESAAVKVALKENESKPVILKAAARE